MNDATDMSTFQWSLFTPPNRGASQFQAPSVVSPSAPVQAVELARVTSRIGASVLRFCAGRVGRTFRAADLAAFVQGDCGGAPASADRVLRALRRQGYVDVEVEDRSQSLYRVRGVRAAAAGGHLDGP